MDILDKLRHRVLVAPMAGGPSTPALVTAAHQAESLGFLASGTTSAEQLRADINAVTGEYGVNLFAAQRPYTDSELREIEELADSLGEKLPEVDYTFGWKEKFDVVLEAAPAVASSTFGCFSVAEISALHDVGTSAWVTVTNPEDARTATEAGADALIVQGPLAGGHRSTWSVQQNPDERNLADLVAAVHAVSPLPLIANGGLSMRDEVARALGLDGVEAVTCGTAFLLAEEAGTSQKNRALLEERSRETTATRAFSGRFARGLATEFTDAHPDLPPSYPQLNTLLKPRRGEEEFAYCLAGVGYQAAVNKPAAEIINALDPR